VGAWRSRPRSPRASVRIALEYIAEHRHSWKNAKHTEQWRSRSGILLRAILALPVAGVEVGQVLDVLKPIWNTSAKPPSGCVAGSKGSSTTRRAPSTDRVTIRHAGAATSTICSRAIKRRQRIKHHAAMPYAEVGAFMAKLRAEEASRRGVGIHHLERKPHRETIGAKWTSST